MEAPKLMVVDDDPNLCNMMVQKLRELGYDAEFASDGRTALEMLREDHFDLAVIDYQMPAMDGVEFFTRAREICPWLVGVFVTAHARFDTIYSAIDAGVSRVLAKPVDFGELSSVLETSLGHPPAMDGQK